MSTSVCHIQLFTVIINIKSKVMLFSSGVTTIHYHLFPESSKEFNSVLFLPGFPALLNKAVSPCTKDKRLIPGILHFRILV